MNDRFLKLALALSIISTILMLASLFCAWYVWESESEDGGDSREFSRDWKLTEVRDTYEYEEDGDRYASSNTKKYNEWETVENFDQVDREQKLGSDYENSVNTFYRTMILVILGIVIAISFSVTVGLSFFKNMDRNNIFILGGMAAFFCILPALMLMMGLPQAMSEDNDNYELPNQLPAEDDHHNLYRYELEGSASNADMKEISGEDSGARGSFRPGPEGIYRVGWHPGIAFYLSFIAGILSGGSLVLVGLTNKDYFSNHRTYHPRNIPAPSMVVFEKKIAIPVAITVVVIIITVLIFLVPWWEYEYETDMYRSDNGDKLGTVNYTVEVSSSHMEGQGHGYRYSDDSHMTEQASSDYNGKGEGVMNWVNLFVVCGIGSMVFALPVLFMISLGRLDLKTGLSFLVLPAVLILVASIIFMTAFPAAFSDDMEGSGSKDIENMGIGIDDSFQGTNHHEGNYTDDVETKVDVVWGPGAGWYGLLAAGLLYLVVPVSVYTWRRDILNPLVFTSGAIHETQDAEDVDMDGMEEYYSPELPISHGTDTVLPEPGQLQCPDCGGVFPVGQHHGVIHCPHCGMTGAAD